MLPSHNLITYGRCFFFMHFNLKLFSYCPKTSREQLSLVTSLTPVTPSHMSAALQRVHPATPTPSLPQQGQLPHLMHLTWMPKGTLFLSRYSHDAHTGPVLS